MSGSAGKSKSKQNADQIWGGQAPFLENLYQQASQQAGQNSGQQYGQQFQDPAYQAFLNQAGGGNTGQFGNQQNLQDIASGKTQNTNLQGAIDAGQGSINRNLQRNILPSVNANAGLAGGSGGSRQGIAQGLAMSDANQQATDFEQQMRSGNYQSGLNSQLGAYNQLGQNQQLSNQAQQFAMGNANNLSQLGFGNQFGNLGYLAQLLGAPTRLGQGGKSSSYSLSGGIK